MPASPAALTPAASARRAAGALAARTLAWALLFGGWLALGALGLRHAPAAAGALAPVALWLLALGLTGRAGASWRPTPRALRAVLAGGAAMAALSLAALANGVPQALWAAAAAWGVLLAAASRVVRGWRRQPGPRLPSPVLPASLGALVAWALAGDPAAAVATPAVIAGAVLAAGLALAALVPRTLGDGTGAPGCRSALFDCALAWPAPAQWREPAHWPWLAATLAMLPMMAALPLMAEGCARAGWPVRAVTGLHLLAMLAPAAVVAASRSATLARCVPALVAAAMVGGGLVALAWAGAAGTMAAMAMHAAAWGLTWAGAMAPQRGITRLPAAHGGAAASAIASAAAVTALGIAATDAGWAVLGGLHAALGVLAALGAVAAGHRPRGRLGELGG